MKYIIFAVCFYIFTNFSCQIYFSAAENQHKNSLKLDLSEEANQMGALAVRWNIRELKHERFWDAGGNRKKTFCVVEPYCLSEFYTTRL